MFKINANQYTNAISFVVAISILFCLLLNSAFAVESASKNVAKMGSKEPESATTLDTESSFVILQYHHVSSETPRITSITPEELESHMAYLAQYHNVISLDTALKGLKNKTPLPKRSVVITFDDGYKNILTNGHPIFKKYGFDYTIFINPAQIDLLASQLSWDDVKKMSKEGVTFANHTLDHLHLLDRYPNENKKNWLARIKKNIKMAESQLKDKLGYSKKWLAYPFGEFDVDVKDMLDDMGYIAFGQHSGGVGALSDMQAVPRYPAAGRYADLETLRTKINSLAMPVTHVRPSRFVIGIEEELGEVQVDVQMHDITFSKIACYFLGESLPIKKTSTGFSIDINGPFYPGRTRVNCTAPSNKESDRFYWYSIPFFTPQKDGTYKD